MGFNSGPPMVPGSYNNNVQILQAQGYVAIVNEMVHNARIVPLDGRPHGSLRQWAGDSRGHWEGNTLVVETINFLRETSLAGSTADTHLVERFRRIDADTVMYEFTVKDQNSYSPAVDRDDSAQANRWAALRVRLSRRQHRAVQHHGGCSQQGHAAGPGRAVEIQIAFSCKPVRRDREDLRRVVPGRTYHWSAHPLADRRSPAPRRRSSATRRWLPPYTTRTRPPTSRCLPPPAAQSG